MSLRRTFWAVLVLLILSGLGAYFTPMIAGVRTPVFFTRLVYLCLILIVLGYLWAYYSTHGFLLTREARVLRQQVGQIFEERFKLSNRSPFVRLWIEVRDDSQLPGNSGSRVLSLIGPRQQRSYIAYTMLNRRGSFHLGPTTLVSGDPFGLFLNEKEIPTDNQLIVLPYYVELTRFPAPVGMFPGGKAIQRRAAEITPQVTSVRDYAPGDALRRIHWPTSARKDRLMTKEFDQDPQADVWIFLDAYEPNYQRDDNAQQEEISRVDQLWLWQQRAEVKLPQDSFEYAVSSAASVANYYIRGGRTVGFVCASDVLIAVSPERGERQLNKILENLTFLDSNGSLPLMGLVEAQAPSLPRASTVVLVTTTAGESTDMAVDYLIMRNLRPVVVFIDKHSFEVEKNGSQGESDIVYRLRQRGIPVQIVECGDDLTVALETEVI